MARGPKRKPITPQKTGRAPRRRANVWQTTALITATAKEIIRNVIDSPSTQYSPLAAIGG